LIEALLAITKSRPPPGGAVAGVLGAQRETIVSPSAACSPVQTLERVFRPWSGSRAAGPDGRGRGIVYRGQGATLKFTRQRWIRPRSPCRHAGVSLPPAYRLDVSRIWWMRTETRAREGAVARPLTGVMLLDLPLPHDRRAWIRLNPLGAGERPIRCWCRQCGRLPTI